MNNAMAKGQRDKKTDLLMICDNSSKIIVLKDTIEDLRREVAEIEKNIGDFSRRLARGKKQWAWFLKKMLKSGCYLRRGVIPILEEMVEIR